MSISWSDVTAIAPPTSTASTATQTAILAAVDRQVDDDQWGELANDGRAYLAAHLATISTGRSGLITSETLGAMSRSYALPPIVKSSLGTTVYGQEYERLMMQACGFSGVVP